MRRCHYLTLGILLCFFQHVSAFLAGTGGFPGEFLYAGSSARGYAMGRSIVAYADDASAVYYNPACLVLDGNEEYTVLNMTPLEQVGTADHFGLQHNFISAKLPLGVAGTVGVGVVLHQIGGIELWSENFDMLGSPEEHNMRDMAIMGSYAKRLFLLPYRLSAVGATLELIWQNHTLPDSLGLKKNSFAFGLDVGLLQQINKAFYVGLNVKHALPPVLTLEVPEPFPTIFKLGLAYKPGFAGEQAGPFGVLQNLLLTTGVDTVLHFSSAHENGWALFPGFHLGAEKWIMIKPGEYELFLRAGLNDIGILLDGAGMELEFVYGFGLRVFDMIKIDIAADTSPMGLLNRVVASFSLRFDTQKSRSEEYIRLAEKSSSRDYGKALARYRMAHEVNPKNHEIYQRIKTAKAAIKRHKDKVRALCKKDFFGFAYDFIRKNKDKSYYEGLKRVYVDCAIKRLVKRQKEEGRESFEKLAKLNLRHFPNNNKLKSVIEQLSSVYWKREVEAVKKMCARGQLKGALKFIEERKEKTYHSKLKDTYVKMVKPIMAERRRKEIEYVRRLCKHNRFEKVIRFINTRKGLDRYEDLVESYVERVIHRLKQFASTDKPRKFKYLVNLSIRHFPKHKRLKKK